MGFTYVVPPPRASSYSDEPVAAGERLRCRPTPWSGRGRPPLAVRPPTRAHKPTSAKQLAPGLAGAGSARRPPRRPRARTRRSTLALRRRARQAPGASRITGAPPRGRWLRLIEWGPQGERRRGQQILGLRPSPATTPSALTPTSYDPRPTQMAHRPARRPGSSSRRSRLGHYEVAAGVRLPPPPTPTPAIAVYGSWSQRKVRLPSRAPAPRPRAAQSARLSPKINRPLGYRRRPERHVRRTP